MYRNHILNKDETQYKDYTIKLTKHLSLILVKFSFF